MSLEIRYEQEGPPGTWTPVGPIFTTQAPDADTFASSLGLPGGTVLRESYRENPPGGAFTPGTQTVTTTGTTQRFIGTRYALCGIPESASGFDPAQVTVFDPVTLQGSLANNVRIIATNPTQIRCNMPVTLNPGVANVTVNGSTATPWTVEGAASPIVAGDDFFEFDKATPSPQHVIPVLLNDVGTNLNVISIGTQGGGAWAIQAGGQALLFTPITGQSGPNQGTTTYVVSDGTNNDSASVTVSIVNQQPVVTQVPPQSVDEGQLLTFGVTASDPDGDTVTLVMRNNPGGANFNSSPGPIATGTFTWTPNFNQSGIYSIFFDATDNDANPLTGSMSVTVTVNEIANPVQAVPDIDDFAKLIPSPQHTILVLANDINARNITQIINPQGGTWQIRGDLQALLYTPNTGESGEALGTVTYEVDDAQGGLAQTSVEIQIVNLQPTFTSITPRFVDEGQELSFGVSASSPDNDVITLSLVAQGPPLDTAQFSHTPGNPATGTFTWTPDFGDDGQYVVQFDAVDDDNDPLSADPLLVTINVADVVQIAAVDDGPYNFNKDTGPHILDVLNNDSGVGISITAVTNESGGTFDFASSGGTQIEYTPDAGLSGPSSCTYEITDSGSATDTANVSVVLANNAPTITPVVPQVVNEGSLLQFTVNASDMDTNDIITLTMSGAPTVNPPSFGSTPGNPVSGLFSWTPDFTQSGTYNLTFTATDDDTQNPGQDQVVVQITVNEVMVAQPESFTFNKNTGQPPTPHPLDVLANLFGGIPPITVTQVTAQIGGSYAPSGDGSIVEFSPNIGVSGVDSSSATYQAIDSIGTQSSAAITVTLVNRAPSINPIPDQVITEGVLLQIPVVAGDPDGDPITLALFNEPTGMTLVGSTIEWTPSAGDSTNSPYTFQVQATDNDASPLSSPLVDVRVDVVVQLVAGPVTDTVHRNIAKTIDVLSEVTGGAPPYRVLSVDSAVGGVAAVTADEQATIFTPTQGYIGAASYNYTAEDQIGAQGTNAVSLTVVNDVPTIQPIPDTTVSLGAIFTYQVVASDLNNDPLTYSLSGHPSDMTISTTGLIEWIVSGELDDQYTITVTVDDGDDTANTVFMLTVSARWRERPINQEVWGERPIVQPQ